MSSRDSGSPAAPPALLTPLEVLKKAGGSALRGGVAGATAQVANVGALMWMRTIMNYQYRYGGDFRSVVSKLYAEGGIPRFYRGLVPALMQAPLSRFGDTAANVGMLALLDSSDSTRNLPIALKTASGSTAAAAFRMLLMPIDAWKTTKQVEGEAGLRLLAQKVRIHGISKLWHGSVGAMTATWVGNFPWFYTHNYLSATLPTFDFQNGKVVRNAFIGFCSSVVSDTISNSLRVVKTTRQTSVEPVTYLQAAKNVVAKDGYTGLFGRGLKTRIVTNGIQGAVFSVAWKKIQGYLDKRAGVSAQKSSSE